MSCSGRSFALRLVFGCFLTLYALSETSRLRAHEADRTIKTNGVWKGELTFSKSDYLPASSPYVMILYVNKTKGMSFEGHLWYPTRQNALVKVAGQIDRKGDIVFTEESVIHGKDQAGMKFTGRVAANTMKGFAVWTGPAFNGPVRAEFFLKLMDQ